MLFSSYAIGFPSLGVAAEGTYYVDIESGSSFQDYQAYFAPDWAPSSKNERYEGFSFSNSGFNLIVFTSILNADIYLLADANAWEKSSPISYGGEIMTEIAYDTDKANGYKPLPYYAINLNPVCSGFNENENCIPNSGGSLFPGDPFNNDPFYAYISTIEYSGTIPPGSYFLAATDLDSNGELNFKNKGKKDPFSPHGASAGITILFLFQNQILSLFLIQIPFLFQNPQPYFFWVSDLSVWYFQEEVLATVVKTLNLTIDSGFTGN
jgi:hypothetical protein